MELEPLTKNQIACGIVLLNRIAEGNYTIEYNQVESLTGIPARKVGTEIGELSKHCHNLGLPLISVMVVSKETHYCGDGFFRLCEELNVHPEFHKNMKNMFDVCMSEVKNFTEWSKLADYMGIEVKGLKTITDPVAENTQSERLEGSLIQVNATAYERDPKLRTECLRIHGTACKICGFNAAAVYGTEFADRIHVHHINPLSEVKASHEVNPKTDLIPVCPNCHMILHSKKEGVYTPEEIKSRIANVR